MDQLDSDLLRTFLAVADTGSVTEGAGRIHRSQSATSLQIKRLEMVLGAPVFDRHGRGVVLSETGRRLIPVAREVTRRLDTTLQSLTATPVAGRLRLGLPDDHGRERLAQIVARFAQTQPQVELEVTCALSTGFPEALRKGTLDLAIYEVENVSPGEELLTEDPTCWVAADGAAVTSIAPLPVAVFDQACWWRDAAIAALEARGRPYRVVYSSQSVSGVVAAVEAGIAVGLLGRSSLHPGLTVLGQDASFPAMPSSKLVLAGREDVDGPAKTAMEAAIRSAFQIGP